MKTVLPFALLAMAVSIPCRADFADGLQAYDRGDFAAALKEWLPTAERGDAHAEYNVGLLYATGGHGVEQNYTEAAGWYRKAAEQGILAAAYNLAILYSNGQGVERDYAQAAKWFTKPAEMGIGIAQQNLGDMYYEKGPFQNYTEALKWYREAAGQGLAKAQYDIGVMYDLGQGVPSDYKEAIKWYRLAAEQGQAGAYTNIGILYYNGQGVKRDLIQAYAWFRRAALAGEPRALDLLSVASEKMSPKEMEKGNDLAASWNAPKTASVEAADRAALEAALFKKPEVQPSGEAARSVPAADAAVQTSAPTTPYEWTGVERIVAVGDLHGDFEQFVSVLESANLIDGEGNWIGGKTHLVQTGDILDRGPDSRRIMDLLMKLERQAAAAGGFVHVLIGNHEAMNVYGDLRYVSPAEFTAFSDPNSVAASGYSYSGPQMLAKPDLNRTDWEPPQEPPGFAAYRTALGPSGKYGKWIAAHNTVIKIDDTLFVHAGISAKYAGWSLAKINGEVREELTSALKLRGGVATDQDGPLWYRGLGQGSEATLEPLVENILSNYGVKRIVIGHTYANGAVLPRFSGKVILIDVGLSRAYGGAGKLGCLLIENDKAYALQRGQKLELPTDSGNSLALYLKQTAMLENAAAQSR